MPPVALAWIWQSAASVLLDEAAAERPRSSNAVAADEQDERGVAKPEYAPYSPGGRPEIGRICFGAEPDSYRIEWIDRDFPTPKTPTAPPADARIALDPSGSIALERGGVAAVLSMLLLRA
jgi:hypothetical protein